jgi:histidinol-phosphate aminotransferase
MNPLLRWVNKIIRFFRPEPAPAVAREMRSNQVIEAATTVVEIEAPKRASVPEEPVRATTQREHRETSDDGGGKIEPQTLPAMSVKPIQEDEAVKAEVSAKSESSSPKQEPIIAAKIETPKPVVIEELPPVKMEPVISAKPVQVLIEPKPETQPLEKPVEKVAEKAPEKKPVARVAEPISEKHKTVPKEKKAIFTGRVEITPALDNPARLRQIKGVISVNDIANRELLDLVPYEPGKPVDDVARELGLDPSTVIKLASNENPLGPSPLAVAAMHQEVERCHFYPDGGGFHLRNAVAHAFGLGRENVVLGNGSNEIIELLFHTFTRPGIHEIVTARHAFAVYTLMAQLFGVHAIEVDDKDFTPDLPAMLRAVTPQTRLIFLASPNNPTGTRVTNEELDAFIRDLPPHVIAVLDEAYYEFLDNPPDSVGYVKQGAQVVLMRTFSKIQGLAGLRIGYGLAPAELANLLQRARQPFNANSIAQAGAMAGLADIEHQKKTKAITDEGRKLIEETFAKMGLKYVPSSANFVLVNVGDGGEVFKRLMKKGIIVRSMVSYHLPAYIRVSVGTPEQNARFLAELPGALEGLVSLSPLTSEVAVAVPSGGQSSEKSTEEKTPSLGTATATSELSSERS